MPESRFTALEAVATFNRWRLNEPGMCLREVRTAHGIPAVHAGAADAWRTATGRHPNDRRPPRGATVFWTGGSNGHIAISLGDGRIRSTDAGGKGRMGTVDLDWPRRQWGLTYVGWAEGYNGHSVKNSPPTYGQAPPKPTPKPDPKDLDMDEKTVKRLVLEALRDGSYAGTFDADKLPNPYPEAPAKDLIKPGTALRHAALYSRESLASARTAVDIATQALGEARAARVVGDRILALLTDPEAPVEPEPSGPSTLRELAVAGGFVGDTVNVAAAVAMAESGGYTDAVGDVDLVSAKWGPSVGLWQIRTLTDPGAWGSADRVRDIEQLRDPLFQAFAALTISKGGTDWTPWSVFNSGSYAAYLEHDIETRTGHSRANCWNLTGKPA